METVKVSTKYQIVIPSEIRKSLDIKPGQKIRVIQFGNRIELVPVKDISEMRGFSKGIDTSFEREEDRL